ncbi:MAG: hypothetical protein AMDU3_IPLC00004G0016 [Thermoplasmatales archaeon I-plasma]|nr:MAG: hypothetical protein AMDU3_IPLC00004G0016 [Thermoplasmatales archaeon I-plasma]
MAAGVLAVIIGMVLMALAVPLLSNFTTAGVRSSGGGEYSSPSFFFVSSDTVTVESQAPIYMVPSSMVHEVSRSSVNDYKVSPIADNSAVGLTTETWSGLSGNYSIISFNSSSINTRVSVTTSPSFNSVFSYSIAVGSGAILFLMGIGMFFAGVILRKKVPSNDFQSLDDCSSLSSIEEQVAEPSDSIHDTEHEKP